MYAYFKGEIAYKDDESIVIEVNNIGYRIFCSSNDINALKVHEQVMIYTYTCVREDAFILYGFMSIDALELFKKLITVSGIGPKMAMSIMCLDVSTIKMAIITQDARLLSSANGVGAKTASRIILELKDKFKSEDIITSISSDSSNSDNNYVLELRKEAMEAMCDSFGFNASDVAKALNKIEINESSRIENIITTLLGMLGS